MLYQINYQIKVICIVPVNNHINLMNNINFILLFKFIDNIDAKRP